MPADAVVATLGHAWKTLSAHGIPAAVMGGLAVTVWRHGRMTQDVDLLIEVPESEKDSLVELLRAAGFRPKGPIPLIRVEDAEFLQMLYEPPDMYLDIQVDFLLARSPYQKLALSRRKHVDPSELGVEVDVMACEDLIVHKLLAMRILDCVDAAYLLRNNRGTIDLSYLLIWVRKLDLTAQFAEIWPEALPDEAPPSELLNPKSTI